MSNEEKSKCARFFQDPEWNLVEGMLRSRIEALKDMTRIDLSQPSDTVKAEVRGRLDAYKALEDFLADAKAMKKVAEREPESCR
ncbi:MAG: hypothetical protein WC551_02690 [Patescibacteria group bacterium]